MTLVSSGRMSRLAQSWLGGDQARRRGYRASRVSPAGRRLRVEALEDRRLLAVGDLLRTIADPSAAAPKGTWFGGAVAIDGPYTVVGMPNAPVAGNVSCGRALVFDTDTGHLVASLENPQLDENSFFGSAVAIAGSTIVVGAPAPLGTGHAYVFDADSGSLRQTLAGNVATDFGRSVAISEGLLIVGAPSAAQGGETCVYDAATGGLLLTLANPTQTAADNFGADVAADGDRIIVGAPRDDTRAIDSGAAYIFNGATGELLQTLNNPAQHAGDCFGSSVAISGDGAVVGAPAAAMAYIFDAATGARRYTLDRPDAAANDHFGADVALRGDSLVVSAPEASRWAAGNGTAYAYDLPSGELVRILQNASPAAYDYFGSAVAISDDVVAVGIPSADTLGYDRGSVQFFEAPRTSLKDTITAPDASAAVGSAVATDGQVVVAGAPGVNSGSGAVYVRDASSGDLLRTLVAPTPTAGDRFGASVALTATQVIVGAPGSDVRPGYAGAVYVYDLSSGQLLHAITFPDNSPQNHIGSSVTANADIIAVAAGTSAGSVSLYDATTGAFLAVLDNPTPQANDQFGAAMAISGHLLAVSAPNDSTLGYGGAGTVYVFDITDRALLHTLYRPSLDSGPAFNWEFGRSLAVAGSTLVVGAPGAVAPETGSMTGRAYLFDLNSGTALRKLINPGRVNDEVAGHFGDRFGSAVALDGDTVLVAAVSDNAVATDSGTVYVFDVASGALRQTFLNPTAATDDQFGAAVAIAGATVVVGAAGDDTAAADGGAAYVFDAAGPAAEHELGPVGADAWDAFGSAVAISGNILVSGAPGVGSGTVYVSNASTGEVLRTLTDPTSDALNSFGSAVALADNTLVVGACGSPVGEGTPGAVFLFDADTGLLRCRLTSPAGDADRWFGYSVAIVGNMVVVGSPTMAADGIAGGAVLLYDAASGAWLRTLHNPGQANADDWFGCSVGIWGGTIIVGAAGKTTPGSPGVGAAYLFDAASGGLRRSLVHPAATTETSFGRSVAIWGNRAVVGADVDAEAYLFDVSNGALLHALTNPATAADRHYGSAVAIWKNEVLVSGWRYANEYPEPVVWQTWAGLFDATTGAAQHIWQNPAPSANEQYDRFGFALAIGDDKAVIGNPSHDGATVDRGAVQVYAVNRPDELYVDFDADGLWAWKNDAAWLNLDRRNAVATVTGDLDGNGQTDLVADFGAGGGLWACMNDGPWVRLHSYTTTCMVAADLNADGRDELVVDFNATDGTWVFDAATASWWKLGGTLDAMAVADLNADGRDELVVDTGAGGILIWRNNSTWAGLHSYNPQRMAVGDLDGSGRDDLIVDFGPRDGLWVYMNDAHWERLHPYTTRALATGDLNGDGRDELVVYFNDLDGTWTFNRATASWRRLGGTLDAMAAADLNGNGRDELIIDTGASGIYVWRNDSAWELLHTYNPGGISTEQGNRTAEARTTPAALPGVYDRALGDLLDAGDALVALDATDGLEATVFKATAAIGRGPQKS